MKDERGEVLSEQDRVKLRFPEGVRCSGVIKMIRPDQATRRGGKRPGSMIVQTSFEVPFSDLDEMLSGIVKLPKLEAGDYAGAVMSRKVKAKGIVRIPKASLDREKRRA